MIQTQLSNPFWGDPYPINLKNPRKFSKFNIMNDQEKMIQTSKKVLAMLEEAYPGVFREDGYTMQSTQLMGMLQQMLMTVAGSGNPNAPHLPPQ